MFSPRQSLIRKLFEKEEPKWIVAASELVSDWDPCLQTLEGHSGTVLTVVISPDGKLLASGSDDCTIRIWDTTSGQCIRILEGHIGDVLLVVFSSDGKYLASHSYDDTVKIWDTTIGECTQTIEVNYRYVFLAFPATGLRLVMGTEEGDVRTWDKFSGEHELVLETFHEPHFVTMILSANGQRLAAANMTHDRIMIWDATSGECLQTIHDNLGRVEFISYLANGQQLASISDDDFVKIWDTVSGKCIQKLTSHSNVTAVAFSPDSQWVAVISIKTDYVIEIWNAVSGERIQTLPGHDGHVFAVAFSPTDQQLASCSTDDMIKMWDITYAGHSHRLEHHSANISKVIISNNGQRLISITSSRKAELWDTASGSHIQSHNTSGLWYHVAAFSPDSKHCALLSKGHQISVLDANSGAHLLTLEGHGAQTRVFIFSPDSRLLAAGSRDGVVQIWDTASGKCLQKSCDHGARVHVREMAFSCDSKRLASNSSDTTIIIWDVTSGTRMQTLKTNHNVMRSLAFSPTDQQIVTCGFLRRQRFPEDEVRELKVWNLISGNCTHTTHMDREDVDKVFFSDDGQRAAISHWDGTISIWNATSWEHIQTISVGYRIESLRFNEGDHCRIHTDVGTFLLGSPLSSHPTRPVDDVLSADASRVGVGISSDGAWIMNGAEKMLWLPPEYRAVQPELRGSTVAMACENGHIWIARMLLDTSTNLNARGLIQGLPSVTPPSSTHQHSGETSSDYISEAESLE